MIIYTAVARSIDGVILVDSSIHGLQGNHHEIIQKLIISLKDDESLLAVGNRKTFVHRNQRASDADSGAEVAGDFHGCWDGFDFWGAACGINDENGTDIEEGGEYYSSEGFFFHVLHGEGAYYLCLSDDQIAKDQSVNFYFLQEVHNDFSNKYPPNKINRANLRGMDKAFNKTLFDLMHHYNINRGNIGSDKKIIALEAQIDTLKGTMGQNISLILNRGDDLEQMLQQSDEMLEESKIFSKRSTTLKRNMMAKSIYYKVIVATFGFLVLYFIAASLCGFTMEQCRSNNQER